MPNQLARFPHIPTLIDRGDPGIEDWTESDLTRDGVWHDLDCSAIVPMSAKFVWLVGRIIGGAQADERLQFRKKGNSAVINVLSQQAPGTGKAIWYDGFVPVGSDGIIQYRTQETLNYIRVSVRGWIA